jgi:alkylation response protein AidB-like acyl-CoA dehydrogenase
MHFDLSQEQLALQRTLQKYVAGEIEPIAEQIDREGTLPDNLIRKMAEIGLLGVVIPPFYGGAGSDNMSVTLACEQLAYSGTGVWWVVAFNNSIPDCIFRFGSDRIKEKYLKSLCNGTAYASIQFTEEHTGSDPRSLMTTAVPEGTSYIINGSKRFSTFGAKFGYAVLYAKDETGGCSAFVIEKNGHGYTPTKKWQLMGSGGVDTVDVHFEDMRVPKENLLGDKGKGFEVLLDWIAGEKILQCAASVGLAQAALDEAVMYAKSRRMKNRSMTEEQGIRWMLAEMYSKLQAARWMTYRAAFLQDRRKSSWMTEAAATKLFVTPVATEIVETARRIHGAYGYIRESKIERISRAIAGAAGIATSLEVNRSIVGGCVIQ